MAKLLLILILGGALVDHVAQSEPPLLIDSSPAPFTSTALDAAE